MLFSSIEFLFYFLPLVAIIYWALRPVSRDVAVLFLLCASIYFYGQFKLDHILIILSSITFNYGVYRVARLPAVRARTSLLLSSGVAFNIGLIAFYKYSGFIAFDVFSLDAHGVQFDPPVLPLAISFFTFQQISFLVDNLEKDRRNYSDVTFLDYAAYIAFFPQLIAGPIVRHDRFLPQLKENKPNVEAATCGIWLFSIGLAKKVLIADNLSPIVAGVFDESLAVSAFDAWVGAVAYTLQLYFDFSGYSDMAIGLGLLFGFQLPINFNSPYKAASIQEFWRRWHITLSDWLRDYLYIRLGGNRFGTVRTYANLVITMLIGGLWHGAGFNFILWGGLHGGALAINRAWSRLGLRLPSAVGWLITMFFVLNAWVLFRATSFDLALNVYQTMYLSPLYLASNYFSMFDVVLIPVAAFIVIALPNSNEMLSYIRTAPRLRQVVAYIFAGLIFAVSAKRLSEVGVPNEFIYFQF